MNKTRVVLGTLTFLFFMNHPGSGADSTAQKWLSTLHHENKEEIKIGQLAQQKAASDEVRSFANHLVLDRRATDQQIEDMAQKQGIALVDPFTNSLLDKLVVSREKSVMTDLIKKSGTAFDRAFIDAMIDEHRRVLNNLEIAEHSIKESDVRDLIIALFPTFEQYLSQAQQLQKNS